MTLFENLSEMHEIKLVLMDAAETTVWVCPDCGRCVRITRGVEAVDGGHTAPGRMDVLFAGNCEAHHVGSYGGLKMGSVELKP